MRTPRRRVVVAAALTILLTLIAGCSAGSSTSAVSTTAASSPAGSMADGSGALSPTERATIRFALDWTPNTNHTGLYVALQQGWFADAGLDVQILPYNTALPETIIDAGNAEFGISFQDSATVAQASGADLVSVMAVLQHWATAIGVRADRADLTSPKDLDGKTYAGFGGPTEEPVLKTVIKDAGGTGDFTTVTLGTSAYEALYSGDVDFTIPFLAWEGIEAEHNGTPMKYFKYADYGFPDAYSIVVIGNRGWLADHPDAARAFVRTLQRGYQFAADNPDAAAQLLMDANPGTFADPSLVTESQELLAAQYMKNADGTVGPQTLAQWAGYGKFLYDNGLLIGPDGAPLTAEPDYSTLFTDDYLSS